jgi:hypothetical protein
MNDNPFVTDSEDSPYLKHHYQEKNWYRGKEVIDVNYFMVDPETILMGWGAYTKDKGYDYQWQKDLFSPINKPSDEHKKAFSVWVLPKYVSGEQNIEHAACLWQRHSYGEYTGFQQMGNCFYEASKLPENQNKLPIIKYISSESISIGMGSTSIPKFELAGFKERPDNFVIPAWYGSEEDESNSPIKDTSSSDAKSTFIDDEIPF